MGSIVWAYIEAIDEQIIKAKGMVTLAGFADFGALGLTYWFFPEKLFDVAAICLIMLCFCFGWCMGLMYARNIIKKKGASKDEC